jgi:hypothetical protein
LIKASGAKDLRGSSRRSCGHGGLVVAGRSSRRGTTATATTIATSGFATAGGLTAIAATTASRCFVQLDLDAGAAEVIQEVEDGGAARFAARIAAVGFAAGRFAAFSSRFAALLFAAGRFAALLFAASRFAAATASLAFEQTLQAGEQVALGLAARIAAVGFTASRFATFSSRFATLLFAAGRFAALLFTAGGLAAATATLTLAKQIVQQFKAEHLASQDDAQ